jgi:hypothetical protein
MVSVIQAREAAGQAGEQYGRQVAELSSPLLASAPAHDPGIAYLRPVLRHIDQQVEKLRGKGWVPSSCSSGLPQPPRPQPSA